MRRAFLVLTVLLAACSAGSTVSTSKAPASVHLTAADGGVTTLSALRGRPLVVNLWATWCHPCVAEMPVFEQVSNEQASHGSRSVSIVGVNIGDDPAAAAAFASKLGVRYPQYTDADGALEAAHGVSNLPATAFFSANGTLQSVHTGAYTADGLRDAIRSNLGVDTHA